MDTRTGRVVVLSPEAEAQMLADIAAGKPTNHVSVRPDEVERMCQMNRQQRRAFVAKRRAEVRAKGRCRKR